MTPTEHLRKLLLPSASAVRGVALLVACLIAPAARADDYDREPIRYSTAPANNVVARLEERLAAGKAQLTHEKPLGYLRSLLRELDVPVSSQTLVFSKTSLQRNRIAPETPRAIYFNDHVYVGCCQGGEVVEVSAIDPQLGTVFYTLDQMMPDKPQFRRQGDNCLICHGSSSNQGVPGQLMRSVFVDPTGLPLLSAGSYRIDHTSPLEKRWGGWYVTGTHGKQSHLGNLVIRTRHVNEPVDNPNGLNVTKLSDRVDLSAYPSPHSDLIALMVLEHQAEGHNLLARANFTARVALHQEAALNRELGAKPGHRWSSTRVRIEAAGEPLVRYLLFCNEAELTAKIAGTSGFAEEFMKQGVRDPAGRSLRDLDLERRLFRYPCSYLVYSPSFDGLPGEMKEYVLHRLWEVVTGKEMGKDFRHLTPEDRQAVREILAATKPDLPDCWREKDAKPR